VNPHNETIVDELLVVLLALLSVFLLFVEVTRAARTRTFTACQTASGGPSPL
jgi:hypothetical protein